MRRQPAVGVLEAEHEADAEVLGAHRVDERAADLAVLPAPPQRPAERVDDPVERLRDLPDLLDADLIGLGEPRADPEVVERDAAQVALGTLGEHGGLREDLRRRRCAGRGLAGPVEAHRRGLDAADGPRALLGQQPQRRRLGLDEHAQLLGLLAHPSRQARQGEDPVALVVERRRRRQPLGATARHEVHALARHRPVGRQLLERRLREQLTQRARVHDRAGELVRAGRPGPSRGR